MNVPGAVFSAIRQRRSIRRYKPDPVSVELVLRLVEAACWAPSAGNRQDWSFTVVSSLTVKSAMAEAVRRRWNAVGAANRDSGLIEDVLAYSAGFGDFERAPAVVVVSARQPDSFQRHILGDDAGATLGSATSAAMAAQNFMLAAHEMGLGTCCMTGALAARQEMGQAIGLPRKQEVVCLISLGWPDERPEAPPRKPAGEVVRFIE